MKQEYSIRKLNSFKMKVKFIILFLAMILTKEIKAQTIQDITGAYTLRGGNHYLKPDQTFVIIGQR